MSHDLSRWFNWLVTHRVKVLIFSLLATVAGAVPMGGLYFQQSQEMWLPQGDNTLEEFNQIRDWFGPNQYLVVSVTSNDPVDPIFNAAALTATREITDYLDGHELVVKVSSLSNHQYMEGDGDSLWLKDFVTAEDYARPSGELAPLLANRLHDDPLAAPQVINGDLTDLRISALITYRDKDILHHVKVVQDLQAFVAAKGYETQGISLHFTGFPFIAAHSALDNMKDQSILMPILLLLLVVFLRVVLGRWAYAGLPLAVAVSTTLITLGIMGGLGFPLNMLNASLPLIIVAISVMDAVHVVSRHNQLLLEGMESKAAAAAMATALWRPCMFTSLTTALGFGALLFSSMQPVREYGLVAAASVLIAYALSLTTLVAWLSYFRRPADGSGILGRVTAFASRIADKGVTHYKPLAFVSMLLLVGGGWAAGQLTADANYVNYFRADSPVSTGLRYFDERFGGANNVEVALDSGREGGILEPAFLGRAAELQEALGRLEGVGTARSLVDYLKDMNRVFTGTASLPENREKASQYLFLYASGDPIEDLTDLRSFDDRYLRLSLPLKNRDASKMAQLLGEIEGLTQGQFKDLKVTLSGDLLLQHKTEQYINKGLAQSFTLSLITIFASLLLLFRSLRYGLLTLVPTLVPLFVAAALMALFDIYLEFGTMIVAAITMGIAVDDAIHIMNEYLLARRQGDDVRQAVGKALNHSGMAVVGTSIILLFSFVVMVFSHFMPNVYFGIFASVIIFTALFSTLLLTPALLALTERAAAPAVKPDLATEN